MQIQYFNIIIRWRQRSICQKSSGCRAPKARENRGAEGGGMWGGAWAAGVPSLSAERSGAGAMPLLQNFFLIFHSGAFCVLILKSSNVFRRFGRTKSFNNWYRDLAHPSTNFRTCPKKCDIWRRLKHHSSLSRLRLKMQQDIRILKQKCNAAMIAICPGQVW